MNTAARIRRLRNAGYLDEHGNITAKGEAHAEERHLGTWAEDEDAPESHRPPGAPTDGLRKLERLGVQLERAMARVDQAAAVLSSRWRVR